MPTLIRKTVDAVQRYGVLELAKRKLRPRPPDPFDATYGTDTARPVPLWRLRIDSPHVREGVHYATAREGHVRTMLDPLPRDVSLLDLGCGKGRILCIAATMGFQRVVGVEFAGALCTIAERNLRLLGLDAEVYCADATRCLYPSGRLAVYLYDPFGPYVMARVAARLRQRPAPTWVVYVNPRCLDCFTDWQTIPFTEEQAALFRPGSAVTLYHH